MELFLGFFISFAISAVLIPVLIRSAGFLRMLDKPDERKIHSIPIPRCGGLGLAIGAIVTLLIFIPFDSPLIRLIVGGGIIILFGLLDDVFDLNYKWKFIGQLLAVSYVLFSGVYIEFLPFCGIEPAPLWVVYPISFVFVVGVTNAVNLSDGLDGLAAGIMLMTLVAIIFFSWRQPGNEIAIIAIALCGGIVGFLRFNTHPATVFMGDTGSQFIGFMAAFLTIFLTQEVNSALNPALPLLLLGVPILDTISVMVQRIRSGNSPFSPDKRHIHHKLLVYGFNHAEAVATIYLLQAVFLTAAYFLMYQSDRMVIGFYLIICLSILFSFYLAGHFHLQLPKHHEKSDRRRNPLRKYAWLFRYCRLHIEYSMILFLVILSVYAVINLKVVSEINLIILVGVFFLIWALPKKIQDLFVRFCIYVSAIYSCYIFSHATIGNFVWLVDAFLAILVLVVIVAITITKEAFFRTTTQDLLVILFILSAILLIDMQIIGQALYRLFSLGYASEYLFNNKSRKFSILKVSAVFSMLTLIYSSLPEIIIQ
jgi:UDP-GlcNAc:undecaprenyl-phosphate/decaprenyl-phosphate GlcNAc-1-phosphate transferase